MDHPIVGTVFRTRRPIANPAPLGTDVVLMAGLPGSPRDHPGAGIFPYEGHPDEFKQQTERRDRPTQFSVVLVVQHPRSNPRAVLDPDLRVRGVPRLQVADASVFPTLLCLNPNITCLMIGERCADLILGVPGSVTRELEGEHGSMPVG